MMNPRWSAKARTARPVPWVDAGNAGPGVASRQSGFGILIYLIAAGVVLAILAGAYFKITGDAHKAGYKEAQMECVAAAKAQREAEAKQAATAVTKLEANRAEIQIKYRTITKTVDRYIDRPIYRNVCLDPDGLRDANAALGGPGTPAGKPDKPVPTPHPATRWDWPGRVAEAD